VWSAVKDHGGFVDVRSCEGEGARFDIYLPITRQPASKSAGSIVLQDYLGTERLLVVDDLPEQAEIAVRLLSKLGYSVASVSGGVEAIEFLSTRSVDLVVLDMMMPETDGLDTLRQIRQRWPRQKAILVSGYSESTRVDEALATGAGVCVRKPFTLETIGLAVRRELDRR
jgi:two-component system, cell cycle sensor histidine kinase and response regulator CckA